MGRSRARKAKRTHTKAAVPELDALTQSYSQFEQDELWSALFAAASSPAARHRAISIGVALAASLRASSISSESPSGASLDIQELVEAAADSKGIDVMQEDYIPTDPTFVATVRVGDELLRCVPGLIERPIADLSRILRLASAVDDRLVRRHKFGIANVVRVALRYVDYCLDTLLPEWHPAPDIKLSDPVNIPANEFEACGRLVSTDPLDSLECDQADLLALEWMTSPAASAKYNHESPTSPFGRTLRYRLPTPGEYFRWLPPTYIPEVLAHAVAELVGGLKYDNHAKQALRATCLETTRRALWRFSNELIESPPKPSVAISPLIGDEIQWLVPLSGPNYIAISILFTEDLPRMGPGELACVTLAERVQAQEQSGDPIPARIAGGGNIKLLPGANIVPLVIVAGTLHVAAPQRPGLATLALEDLTWIAETATEDDDLYRFVRDLSSPDFPSSFGWEGINYWEPWRANGKSFFKGGISPTHMHFAPHAGEAEWERAVTLSPLETALFRTGLPPLRHAVKANIDAGNIASILFLDLESEYDYRHGKHYTPDRTGWSVTLNEPPIAISRSTPYWTEGQEHSFLFDVCGGLISAFDAIRESWKQAHVGNKTPGYQLLLRADKRGGEIVDFSAPRAQREDAPHAALWCFDLERFVQEGQKDIFAANGLTTGVLKQLLECGGVDRKIADDIGREWLTCRPFLIIETKTAQTKLNFLSRPWPLSSSDESAVTVSFARRLHAIGVQPGRYRGADANTLVKQHLAPAALEELSKRIAFYDTQTIVSMGMEQLNRVSNYREEIEGNLSRVSQYLSTEWDPVERMVELTNETLKLRQCNEIIVEAALRAHSGAGVQEPITAHRWSEFLAAADAYRNMTLLSEQLHHRVATVSIEISAAYELLFKEDAPVKEDAWVLEEGPFNTAAASSRLESSIDRGETNSNPLGDSVDQAMIDSFGASTSDLILTLLALARWESFNNGRTVAHVSEGDALSWIYTVVDEADEEYRARLQHAFRMLTLSSEILRSIPWRPWQTRTRRHRLLVQPLVRVGDGTILIAPQYLLTALAVYKNYLKQGVLPWTGEVPIEVSRALEERRAERNKAFEMTLERQLREVGFETIARVKPGDQARLGVPKLTTEIDLVCGRRGDSNIWLIEAKDPVSVHGFAETARQLKTFYSESKEKGKSKPSYASQLSRKEAELKPYVNEIAKKLKVSPAPDNGDYVLQTRFVTRHLTPAGFEISRPYEVLTMEKFLSAIRGAEEISAQS